jgi:hypothetical protein
MANDALRSLTGLYKLVEKVHKLIVERTKGLMLRIGFCFPMLEMGLVPCPEKLCDEFFHHSAAAAIKN